MPDEKTNGSKEPINEEDIISPLKAKQKMKLKQIRCKRRKKYCTGCRR